LPPPPICKIIISYKKARVKEEFFINTSKKMGRPTTNPRTKKIGFRMSKNEIDDIQKCADVLQCNRVDAVVEGIKVLKKELKID